MRDGGGPGRPGAQRYARAHVGHTYTRRFTRVCTYARARMCRTSGRELPSPFPGDASLDPDKVCDPPPAKLATATTGETKRTPPPPPSLVSCLPSSRPQVGIADAGGEAEDTRYPENSIRPSPRPPSNFRRESGL